MTKFLVVCILGLAVPALCAGKGDWSSDSSSTSPVQKVIELMASLKGKIANDLEAEKGLMAEFSDFCDKELADINYAIETAAGQITDFNAGIEDAQAQISALGTVVAESSSKIAAKETELSDAQKVRDAGNRDFQDNERELSNSIDELTRAVVAAKKDMSFVQVNGKKVAKPNIKAMIPALQKIIEASSIPQTSRNALKGFLQQAETEGDDLALKQPQGTVSNYDSHSGGILDTLTDMEEKAQGQLSDLRKAEMEAQFSFEMVKQGINDEIRLLKEKVSDATSQKAAEAEALGKEKGELAYTTKTRDADKARLAGQTQECRQKTEEWEIRQKSAAEEMAVIDKATEILSSGVKSLLQAKTTVKRSASDGDDEDDKEEETRDRLSEYFKTLSKKFGSFALTQMVSSARSDPFGKIRGLIEDMIEKLVTEANEEANQKAFCDEEQAKARASQKTKSMTYDKFTARLDEAASKKEVLGGAIVELQAELAEIDGAQKEATKIRSEEHTEYAKVSKDLKDSADAVVAAVSVLKSYYEGSFIQLSSTKKQPGMGLSEGPEFGGAGKTAGDSAHTIIEVLEVAEEDFTKQLAQVEAEEEANAAEFDKNSKANAVAKAQKSTEVKDKQSEVKSLAVAIDHHTEDRAAVSKELDAVVTYLDKLKPTCESKAMSYEEKKARREAEIEGLKEAMGILEGEAVAVVEEGSAFLQRRSVTKHA